MQLNPIDTAIGAWPSNFDQVLSEATSHLKNGNDFHAQGGEGDLDPWLAKKPFGVIFSVASNNLPLAGHVPNVANLRMCAAIWVTTAADTAKLVSREILREIGSSSTPEDQCLMNALSPARFQGIGSQTLTRQALGKYNDISTERSRVI